MSRVKFWFHFLAFSFEGLGLVLKVYLLVRLIGGACEEVVVEVKESHVGEFLEKGLANSKKKKISSVAMYSAKSLYTDFFENLCRLERRRRNVVALRQRVLLLFAL